MSVRERPLDSIIRFVILCKRILLNNGTMSYSTFQNSEGAEKDAAIKSAALPPQPQLRRQSTSGSVGDYKHSKVKALSKAAINFCNIDCIFYFFQRIQEARRLNSTQLFDLYRRLDVDGNGELGLPEFLKVSKMLHLEEDSDHLARYLKMLVSFSLMLCIK